MASRRPSSSSSWCASSNQTRLVVMLVTVVLVGAVALVYMASHLAGMRAPVVITVLDDASWSMSDDNGLEPEPPSSSDTLPQAPAARSSRVPADTAVDLDHALDVTSLRAPARISSHRPFDHADPPQWLREYGELHRRMMQGPASERRLVVFSGAKLGLGDQLIGIAQCLLIGVLTDRAVVIQLSDNQWHHWMHAPQLGDTRYEPAMYANHSRSREVIYNSIPDSAVRRLTSEDLNEAYPGAVLELPAINMVIVSLLRANPRYAARIAAMALVPEQPDSHTNATTMAFDLLSLRRDNQPLLPAGAFYVPARFVCSYDVAAIGTLYWAIAQPTAALQQLLDESLRELLGDGSDERVFGAIHMRSGFSGDSDFQLEDAWFWQCAERYMPWIERWLVVSDSAEMQERAVAHLGREHVLLPAGDAKHVRFHGSLSRSDFGKLLVDHLLLAEANVAIVSPSQFSRLSLARHHYCPHLFHRGPAVDTFQHRHDPSIAWPALFFGVPCTSEHLFLEPRDT